MKQPLILGSASERRRKILRGMGVAFEAVAPQVEEVSHEGDPRRTVAENALRKMAWCRERYPGCVVLTADTALSFRGRPVEKPSSLAQARDFLRMLSGERHSVLTAVAFCDGAAEPEVTVVESIVVFKRLDDETIRRYIRSVNPLDKAGAYDIDQSPELIIEMYSGSRTNIMGLPVETVAEWLKRTRNAEGGMT